jgi:hypothetical protein
MIPNVQHLARFQRHPQSGVALRLPPQSKTLARRPKRILSKA